MKQKKLRTVIRMTVLVIAGILLGLGIYHLNAEKLLGDPMPMPLGIGVSVVMSGSMEPELSIDDVIIVKKTDEFYVDQLVVFRDGGSMVVHRVIAVDGNTLTTKGDANNTEDAPIDVSAVKGEVVAVIPAIGGVVEIIRQPVVIILVAALAILLFELSFRKEKKKDSDEMSRLKEEIAQLSQEVHASSAAETAAESTTDAEPGSDETEI